MGRLRPPPRLSGRVRLSAVLVALLITGAACTELPVAETAAAAATTPAAAPQPLQLSQLLSEPGKPGMCTPKRAQALGACTSAIKQIDCYTDPLSGCIAGVTVSYRNDRMPDTHACSVGDGNTPPTTTLHVSRREVLLSLEPRSARARLPLTSGDSGACVTRLTARTSARRSWVCDARGRSSKSLAPITEPPLPPPSAAAPIAAQRANKSAPVEPNFVCDLLLSSSTCKFFMAPDTRLGPLDLGLGLLAAAPTSRACWYMSCAGAAVRLTPPPPPKSKASASAAACSNGSSAAAPAGSTGHSGNDSSMATPRGIPADWLAALAVKRGTAALSGAPAAHDAPPLLYGNESQGFCPALRDCQAGGYRGGGGCGSAFTNPNFTACTLGQKPFGTVMSFSTDTAKNLLRVWLDKVNKVASPFIGDVTKDLLKLFWPPDPQTDQLRILWDRMEVWVKSFVAQELRNMLTQERQRFLWGLYNTVDTYNGYDVNNEAERLEKRQALTSLITSLQMVEAQYIGATFGAATQTVNQSWTMWDVMVPYCTTFMSLLLERVVNYEHLYPQANSTQPAPQDVKDLNYRARIKDGYPGWVHNARTGVALARLKSLGYSAPLAKTGGAIQWSDDFTCYSSPAIPVNNAGHFSNSYAWSTYGVGCPFSFPTAYGCAYPFSPFSSAEVGTLWFLDNFFANTLAQQRMALDWTTSGLYTWPGFMFPNTTNVTGPTPQALNSSFCNITVETVFQVGGVWPSSATAYDLTQSCQTTLLCGPGQSQPFPLPQGDLWSDLNLARNPNGTWNPIRRITMWAGGHGIANARWWQVFGIRASYDKGGGQLVDGYVHGVQGDSDWGKTGFSLPWSILPIPEGQWITSVYVCADLLVRYIKITTNTGAVAEGGLTGVTNVKWYPTDTQSTYWLPTVTGSCDTIYNAEFAVPDNSDARLLYLESRTLPPLKNYDQTDMKRLWVISPDKDTRNTHLLDRFSTSLARTHFVFGHEMTFFKGFDSNPIMVCDVDIRRVTSSGAFPTNANAAYVVSRLTKGRDYSGRMQCAGRPGVDTCSDAVCPLPAAGGVGQALDCTARDPPTGFP